MADPFDHIPDEPDGSTTPGGMEHVPDSTRIYHETTRSGTGPPTTEIPAATAETASEEEETRWSEGWRTRGTTWVSDQWNDGSLLKRILLVIAAVLLALLLWVFASALWNACTADPYKAGAPVPTPAPVPVTTPSATTQASTVPVGPVPQVDCSGLTEGGLRVDLFQSATERAQLDSLRGTDANTVTYAGGYADPAAMINWINWAYCDGLMVEIRVDKIYAGMAANTADPTQLENNFLDYLTQLQGADYQVEWAINANGVETSPSDGEGTPGTVNTKRLARLVHRASNKPIRVQIDFFNTDNPATAVQMGERYLNREYVSEFGDYLEIVFTPDVPDETYGPPELYKKVGVTTALTQKNLGQLFSSAVVQASDEGSGRPTPDEVRQWVNWMTPSGVTNITILTDPKDDTGHLTEVVAQAGAALELAQNR